MDQSSDQDSWYAKLKKAGFGFGGGFDQAASGGSWDRDNSDSMATALMKARQKAAQQNESGS